MAGVITAFKLKTTKKGSNMAYATLEDVGGSIELLVFSNALTASGMYLHEDSLVLAHGRVSAREDEEPKLVCDEVFPLTEAGVGEYLAQRARRGIGRPPRRPGEPPAPPRTEEKPRTLYLRVPGLESPAFAQACAIMAAYPGQSPVILLAQDTGRKMRLRQERWVAPVDEMMSRLKTALRPENVVLK